MKLLCLNLNLGPGRSLQHSDLQYMLSQGIEVICYCNGEALSLDGWSHASIGDSGVSLTGPLKYRDIGSFKKWAILSEVGDYSILTVRSFTPAKILRKVKSITKAGKIAIVHGDWDRCSTKDFDELRKELAYYGFGDDGILVSDAGAVTNLTRLGVTHIGTSVVQVELR